MRRKMHAKDASRAGEQFSKRLYAFYLVGDRKPYPLLTYGTYLPATAIRFARDLADQERRTILLYVWKRGQWRKHDEAYPRSWPA